MRITLPTGTPAELARPDGAARRTVVIVPDINGLRPLFDDLCRDLATANDWVVVAIELWPGREDLPLEEKQASVGTLSDERLMGDVVAAAEAGEVEPAAVIGFCTGGMVALKAAATARFDRAVSFYGMVRLPEAWRSDTMGEPLDVLGGDGTAPILCVTGTADTFVPNDDADSLEATGATVVRYEGAEHGFAHDPARPAHRPDDAADAWARAITFIEGRD